MTLNAAVSIRGFRTIPETPREWNNFFREQFQAAITGTVTLADMAPIATDTLIGRSTAGTGVPELVTATAAARTLLSQATAALQRTALGLASGTYTPTLFNTTNVAASTAYQCQYLQVGSVVTVSGKVDADPTAAVATVLGISLPIASNLGAAEDCAGTGHAPGIAGQSAAIVGDVANDRATLQWVAVDVTNQSWYFQFMYEAI
jgi:hypothetical protein